MYTTMNVINMCKEEQRHTHEFLGSTDPAGPRERRHNHRFAGVTGEAIPTKGSHVHEYCVNTDFTEEHFHMMKGKTGPAIELPDGHHIHYEDTQTSFNAGHKHKVEFTTMIVPGY